MPFSATIDVRFGDCDPAGIVYYPVLYHYCHVAFEEAWRHAIGVPYPELVNAERIGFPTVHVETDFVSPARYGDRVEIAVSVEAVGSSSATFAFEARVGDRLVFRSRHVTVCVALDAIEKRPIPDRLRAALERIVS
jgi:YbgC/YbaW family acyl-CoA thioester hydrolase